MLPKFEVEVPDAEVCQYQVSPPVGVPERVKVTPGLVHCGESDVGFPGADGSALTTTFTVLLEAETQVVVAFVAIT